MAKVGEVTLKVNLDTEDLMQKLVNHELSNPTKLLMKRVSPTVESPFYATTKASRLDLHAALDHVEGVSCWLKDNSKTEILVNAGKEGQRFIDIPPKARVLIPTGFIFGIPEHYELTIVPRSSAAIKKGLSEANCVGVIDQDFTHETHLAILNISEREVRVVHNDRISQGKLEATEQVVLEEVEELPEVESNREGGFGSTDK